MLQATMEMGILVDFRNKALADDFQLSFTPDGEEMFKILKPLLQKIDLSFVSDKGGDYSWRMKNESSFNQEIKKFITEDVVKLTTVRGITIGNGCFRITS